MAMELNSKTTSKKPHINIVVNNFLSRYYFINIPSILFLMIFFSFYHQIWPVINVNNSNQYGSDIHNNVDTPTTVVVRKTIKSESELSNITYNAKQEKKSLVSLPDRPPRKGKARVLMGIFCRSIVDKEYQEMFRLLFALNPLVCSLGRYEQDILQGIESRCQLIYTFVIGGNKDTWDGPTELLDDHIPILLEKGNDYVILNIVENMNLGKSQTWFYFASTIMNEEKKFNFDYVGKMDTDTMPYLDKYFDFADNHLPPSPYNLRTMVGHVSRCGHIDNSMKTNKAWWKKNRNGKWAGMHVYPRGQLYILSKDLVSGVVAVAQLSASGSVKYVYSAGHEDHDIAAMAYISAEGKPMNLVKLRKSSIFWRHGVKRSVKRKKGAYRIEVWKQIWTNEIKRTKGALDHDEKTLLSLLPSNITYNAKQEKFALQNSWWDTLDLGWSSLPPQWLLDMCPEVVAHFNRFPSFNERDPKKLKFLPIFPTDDVAHSVCTTKVVQIAAASINARVYLHAGSHLGAVIHGQPIPWDDDIDLTIEFQKIRDFEKICQGDGLEVHPSGVRLRCVSYFNSLKVWLHPPGYQKMTPLDKEWYSPFVDLFAYEIGEGKLKEVFLDRNSRQKPKQTYFLTDYFPTRPYYFAGIHVLGPQAGISESRYSFDTCRMGNWNHRIERNVNFHVEKFGFEIDCNYLSKRFPFRNVTTDYISVDDGTDSDAANVLKIPTSRAANMDTITVSTPTVEERKTWYKIQSESKGQELTESLERMNEVEIDNSILPQMSCTGPLKIVELNAERGRWWLESSTLVKDADIIIFNEMDIGMARSDNQHTTRLMAHHLGMNYAWGLEFVELTPGNEDDRENAHGIPDFYGLHGNAFLTKCAISDAIIFRNKIGPYFDSKANRVNANGFEKRLGGRMGMLGRIIVDGKEIVIGSIHKIEGFQTEIKEYIGDRNAVLAGDQDGKYCDHIGLRNIVSKRSGKTWPASCSGFGRIRGDNICSNMKITAEETTILPCVNQFGFSLQISDHALTSAVLAVH